MKSQKSQIHKLCNIKDLKNSQKKVNVLNIRCIIFKAIGYIILSSVSALYPSRFRHPDSMSGCRSQIVFIPALICSHKIEPRGQSSEPVFSIEGLFGNLASKFSIASVLVLPDLLLQHAELIAPRRIDLLPSSLTLIGLAQKNHRR